MVRHLDRALVVEGREREQLVEIKSKANAQQEKKQQ
jgi:hypothetical protein